MRRGKQIPQNLRASNAGFVSKISGRRWPLSIRSPRSRIKKTIIPACKLASTPVKCTLARTVAEDFPRTTSSVRPRYRWLLMQEEKIQANKQMKTEHTRYGFVVYVPSGHLEPVK